MLVTVVISLLVGGVSTLLVGPRVPSLPTGTAGDTGDPVLAARVHEVFAPGRGYGGVSVAIIKADGSATFAGVGSSDDPARPAVDEDTAFEIGSVTKGLTGMLVAEQVERGEASLDDRLAGATLGELATHRSGLPRLPLSMLPRGALARLSGGDPYSGDAQEVLALARGQEPSGGAEPTYSNLGAAAAGQLVAARAGASYPDLLRERVLSPLGMRATTVVTREEDLPAPRAHGTSASGRAQAPWIASGWAPAGIGVWSTASDLSRLVAALADASAPGADATAPRTPLGPGAEVGLFWITTEEAGRQVTWHDGGTGGSSSFVGFEPASGRGVVVLATTDAGVDAQALELLTGGAP